MQTIPRVNFPPDPNPKTPKLKAPPGSWDTHFHVWGPPQIFPYAEKRNHTPPAAPIEHYLLVAKVLGLDRGVMVQPNAHGTDTRVTLDAIARLGPTARGVAVVYISHKMDEVFALADRITVLVYGRAIATGTPQEIRAAGGAGFVVHAFLASVGRA